MNNLERQFYNEMKDIYIKADKECGYRATRLLQNQIFYGKVKRIQL